MTENIIVDQRQVPLEGAEQATVEFHVRKGSLNVIGGATELIEAVFEYTDPARRPEIEVDRDGSDVEVEIEQPEPSRRALRETNRWQVALNSVLPVELNTAVSNGSARYDLTHVNLSGLDLESSSGSTVARLAGDYRSLGEVAINGSSGSIDLDMPGTFSALERVDIETSSGSLTVGLTGEYQSLRKCKISTNSGSVRLDLSGNWQCDADVRLTVTSGSIRLKTPEDVGVIVVARVTTGNVSAHEYLMKNDELHNNLVGISDITLRLALNVTSGNVRIT